MGNCADDFEGEENRTRREPKDVGGGGAKGRVVKNGMEKGNMRGRK
jgi:hypothetical protein